MPSECPSRDELSGLILGMLTEERADVVSDHVEQCPACEETILNLEDTADSVVEKLRQPDSLDPFTSESDCQRVVELVEAIGRDPSFSIIGGEAAPAPEAEELGTIRSYRLLAKLGQGGMGSVYKALHVDLDKVVALKVLPEDRLSDEAAVARFRREMKAVGKLNHPNIVQATDAGEEDGMHYLVMELVDGIDLARLVKECGPLPVAEACELICQAAAGLQHAHENGLVHRDIKPSNVMVSNDPSPRVKILDMGLALLDVNHLETASDLTGTGQIMGTIDYMAPEQGSDTHSVDIRADVYSLGATLYKLLTGRAPFEGPQYNSPIKKLTALANTEPERVDAIREDVPAELADLVQRMLAKSPDKRPATPSDVSRLLTPFGGSADLGRLMQQGSVGKDATEGIIQDDRTTDPTYVAETNVAQPDSVPATAPFEADSGGTAGLSGSAVVPGNDRGGTPGSGADGRGHDDSSHALPDVRACHTSTRNLVSDGVGRTVRRPALLVAGIATLALLMWPFAVFLAGMLFRVESEFGTVIVEIMDDSVAAELTTDGIRIVDRNDPKVIFTVNPLPAGSTVERRLAPGEYELIDVPGVELEITGPHGEITIGREFTMTDSGRVRIRVTAEALAVREPRSPGSGLDSAPDNFALQFDGQVDYIATPARLDVTRPHTVEAFVTVPGVPGWNQVAVCDANLGGFGLGPRENGKWRMDIQALGGRGSERDEVGYVRVESDNEIEYGRRTHVAAVYDGRIVRLFIDGRGQSQPRALQDIVPSTLPVFIGANPNADGESTMEEFLGTVDEVRLSSVARYTEDFTPEERFEPDEHTLAMYHFDEGKGAVLIDSSGNDHHGTIHGATWVKQVGPETWVPYDADRRAAEWIIAKGGHVGLWVDRSNSTVTEIEDLPSEQFIVTNVHLSDQPNVTDDDLQRLLELQRIQLVHLHNTGITDAGIEHLTELEQLLSAYLWGTDITDAAMESLSRCRHLETVNLGGTAITPAGIATLANSNPSVRRWYLSPLDIGDETLEVLAGLPDVTHLGLTDTRVTRAGIEKFQELHPGCRITSDFGVIEPASSQSVNFALQFDGVDDSVEIPTLTYDGSHPITLEVWATPSREPKTAGTHLVTNYSGNREDGSQSGVALQQRSTDETGSGWAAWVATEAGLGEHARLHAHSDLMRPRRRSHVAMTLDSERVRLFVDGDLVANEPVGQEHRASPLPFRLGVDYPGTLDEIRISSIARYTEDFTPVGRFEPDEHTLVLYHFVDGEGDVLIDATGNDHHGTIHGATWVKQVGPESWAPYDSHRRLAEWVWRLGGRVGIGNSQVLKADDADYGDSFNVLSIMFWENQDVPPELIRAYGELRVPPLTRSVNVTSNQGLTVDLIQAIAELSDLRHLNLSKSAVTDEHLRMLGACDSMETLDLDDTTVTDAGLSALAGHPMLWKVDLRGTEIGDAGLVHLARIEGLHSVYLQGTEITDAGLAHLEDLKLKALHLQNTSVTDASIPVLTQCTTLEELSIANTDITESGVNQLRDALPDCRIVSDFGTFEASSSE